MSWEVLERPGRLINTNPCIRINYRNAFLNKAFTDMVRKDLELPLLAKDTFLYNLMYDEERKMFAINIVDKESRGTIRAKIGKNSQISIYLTSILRAKNLTLKRKILVDIKKINHKKLGMLYTFSIPDEETEKIGNNGSLGSILAKEKRKKKSKNKPKITD